VHGEPGDQVALGRDEALGMHHFASFRCFVETLERMNLFAEKFQQMEAE
jgi:hypothetical protein